MNRIKILLALVLISLGSLSTAKIPSNQQQYNHHLDKIQILTEDGSSLAETKIDKQQQQQQKQGPNYENDDDLERKRDEEEENGIIETFERVVLEGSRISISCPHSSKIIRQKQQPFNRNSRVQQLDGCYDGTKQFATPNGKQLSNKTTACHEFEQVKWFRNHVHLNHFNPDKNRDNKLEQDFGLEDRIETSEMFLGEGEEDLNWTTTELFQTPTSDSSIIRTEEEEEDGEEEQANQFDETFDLPTKQRPNSSSSLTSSENVNELVGRRKQSNTLSPPATSYVSKTNANSPSTSTIKSQQQQEWFLNEFGELVINRVTQYFAGKYTCLMGGKRSQVLLDVLLTGDTFAQQESKQQAYKVVETTSSSSSKTPNEQFEKGVKINSLPSGKSSDFSGELAEAAAAVKGGNEPIEKATTSDYRATEFEKSLDLNSQTKGEKGEKEEQRNTFVKLVNNSQVDNNSSQNVNSITNLKGERGLVESTDTSFQLLDEISSQQSEELVSFGGDKEEERSKKVPISWQRFNSGKQQQHHKPLPIHVVQSEAIQVNDLKLIPGFLYTKQQLYCPISGLSSLQFKHIFPLINAFCTHKTDSSKSKLNAQTKDEELIKKCYRQAKLLIKRLVSSGSPKELNYCSESIFDFVWYKDGKELKFAANGRAHNLAPNLNVKLVNSIGTGNLELEQVKKVNLEEVKQETDFVLRDDKREGGGGKRSSLSGERQLNNDNNNKRMICSPGGRSLEIDGIRKESGGRYTCALKLSPTKLDKLIKLLRQFNEPNRPIRWLHEKKKNSVPPKANDKSCCDTKVTSSNLFPAQITNLKGEFSTQSTDADDDDDDVEREFSSSNLTQGIVDTETRRSRRIDNNNRSRSRKLAKQTKLLESILNGTISSNHSLTYIGHLLANAKLPPPKTIQTFSLVVVERTANSCDLWSTILEAGYAYTRRKLADFKRLKRNSNSLSISSQAATSSIGGKNVYSIIKRNGSTLLNNKQPNSGISSEAQLPLLTNVPNQSEQLNTNDYDDELENGAKKEEELFINSSNRLEDQYQRDQDNGIIFANANIIGAKASKNNHDKLAREREGEEEEPLYGWHSISGIDDRVLMVANGDGSSSSNSSKEEPTTLLNNSVSFEADIAPSAATRKSTESAIGGQTNIHTVEAEPFNYANERNSQLLYATTSSSSNPMEAANNEQTVLWPDRQRSPMIKGNHEYSRLKEAGTKEDLITQRANSQRINAEFGRQMEEEAKFHSTSTSYSEHRNKQPASNSKWHPMVIDGIQATTSPLPLPAPILGNIIDSRQSSLASVGSNKVNYHDSTNDLNIPFQEQEEDLFVADDAKQEFVSLADNEESGISRGRNGKGQPVPLQDKLMPSYASGASGRLRRSSSSGSSNKINSLLQDLRTTQSSGVELGELTNKNLLNDDDDDDGDVKLINSHKLDRRPRSLADQPEVNDHKSISDPETIGDDDLAEFDQPSIANSFTKPMAYDERFDESLMWTAGQYLYMHMRALAASSMFGVEVAVEWSNERSNGTNIDFGNIVEGDKHNMDLDSINKQSDDGVDYLNDGRIRDAVPFATIDVISGQSLQLQCTAQALGRLPEVRWYKRVKSIPSQLKDLAIKMARKIEHDLYWPLTELDILNEYETPKRERSFVCSQTIAIFDNLANQTFTVISSLKLSQYNDILRGETIKPNPPPLNNDYNLYACIVDADIRHNYATLGVHFREAPSEKISPEISKRLQARSALKMAQDTQVKSISLPEKGNEKYTNFDLYRDGQLQFPLKTGFWIPIQNSSSYRIENSMGEYSLTPTMLSTVIVFVFGSLLGLMYLTLRTYRNLTQNQLEEDLINQLEECSEEQLNNVQGPRGEDVIQDLRINVHSGCSCQYGNQSDLTQQISPMSQAHMMFSDDSYTTNLELNKTDYAIGDSIDQIYYRAHDLNDIGPQCICHNAIEPALISTLPSNKSDYSYNSYDHKAFTQEHIITNCCQSNLIPMLSCQQNSRPRVNLIENPLDDNREQYFNEKSQTTDGIL